MPFATSNESSPTHIAVPIETVCEGTVPQFDFYLRNPGGRYVLFAAAGAEITPESRKRIQDKGRRVLYVRRQDAGDYYRYVSENIGDLLQNPATPYDQKAGIVYETATHLMEEVLEDPDSEENIQRAQTMAENTATLVTAADRVENLLAMTRFDYTTQTHCVNVCVYGLGLARRLGIHNPAELKELGAGLLLHDVGKAKVNQDILNKPARLSPFEFEAMKKHTRLGEQVLRSRDGVPPMAVRMAGEHHERVDGGGYPRGLRGEDIHEYSRITAIIDVFDALTTNRPYKEAMPTYAAFRLMKADAGHLDAKFLDEFIIMLQAGSAFKTT